MRQRALVQLLAGALVATFASGVGLLAPVRTRPTGAGYGSDGRYHAVPTPGPLVQVTLPDLSSVAAPVQQQIRGANEALSGSLVDGSTSDLVRAQRYGDLGNLLLAATFFDEAILCYRHAEALQPGDARWPYLRAHASPQRRAIAPLRHRPSSAR